MALALTLSLSLPAQAHEFWIAAPALNLPENGQFRPDVQIGDHLQGTRYGFEPRAYARTLWRGPDSAADLSLLPLTKDTGALPALGRGLHSLSVQSYPQRHIHSSARAFRDYVTEIGLADQVDSTDPGRAADGAIVERYRRLSKTLVHIGGDTGTDQHTGLDLEWVRTAEGFRLMRGRRGVAGQPAYLQCRVPGTKDVSRLHLVTDRKGRIRQDIETGTTCLLNTVLLRRQADGTWFSDWVSLYFAG